MSRFSNSKTAHFLSSIPVCSFDDPANELTQKCKFNFAYFTVQDAGQNFCDWTKDQLENLLSQLKDYSEQSLSYWRTQPVRGGPTRLSIYEKFPAKSDFTHPKHVPHQAHWGRFRLSSAVRLVGFVVPSEYQNKAHDRTKVVFDCNTFYVVFLDANHRFFITEPK